mmetsp:Transcript_26532/g.68382  ORF Transcript_26532/g.68382 Transcript_26532/m.68382 type:complete len:286 (-) Transcript_26532:202-1059(-)
MPPCQLCLRHQSRSGYWCCCCRCGAGAGERAGGGAAEVLLLSQQQLAWVLLLLLLACCSHTGLVRAWHCLKTQGTRTHAGRHHCWCVGKGKGAAAGGGHACVSQGRLWKWRRRDLWFGGQREEGVQGAGVREEEQQQQLQTCAPACCTPCSPLLLLVVLLLQTVMGMYLHCCSRAAVQVEKVAGHGPGGAPQCAVMCASCCGGQLEHGAHPPRQELRGSIHCLLQHQLWVGSSRQARWPGSDEAGGMCWGVLTLVVGMSGLGFHRSPCAHQGSQPPPHACQQGLL